jgi:putative colanic acid biosynthesis acetyltransferase WcaF
VNEPSSQPLRPIFQTLDRCTRNSYTRGEYIGRIAWHFVQATLFRVSPRWAYGFRRFLLRCFGAKLGPHAAVHQTVRIMHPWLLEMADRTMIGPNATVYNLGRITIGNHTLVSQEVYLCGGTHDHTDPTLPLIRSEVHIGAGVWIAAGAFIGPAVKVGDNSVIGARAVVMSDVPAGVIAAGNPCKVIRPRPMQEKT